MKRGDIFWYSFKAPDKRRPVLLLTRDSAIPVLTGVTVAPITRTIRDIPTEVVLTADDGVPEQCAANFDNIQTVPKHKLGERIARVRCGFPRRNPRFSARRSFDFLIEQPSDCRSRARRGGHDEYGGGLHQAQAESEGDDEEG